MFSLGSLRSLKPFLLPYKNWLIFSLLMAIPLSALRTAPVVLMKYLVDEVLVRKDSSDLRLICFGLVGLSFLNIIVRFFHYYSIRIVVVNVNQKIREKLFGHLMGLSADFFSNQNAGALLSRVAVDPAHLDNGIASLNVVIREPLTFIVLLGYTFYLNWRLTLLTFTIAPALAFVFGRTGKYIKRKIAEYQEHNGQSYSTLQESISGIRIIHLFNLQKPTFAKLSGQLGEITRLLLKISKMEEVSSPSVEFISAIAVSLILFYGGMSVIHGVMTSGDLIAFFTAFSMMINPIRQLADINSKLHSAAAAMERINDFLGWKSKISDRQDPRPVPSATGSRHQRRHGILIDR